MRTFVMRGRAAAGVLMLAIASAPCLAADATPDHNALKESLSEAQVRLDEAAREVADLSRQLYGGYEADVMRFVGKGRRGAMLGVNIGSEKPRDTGVEIVGVSPGGPAETAGLRPSDVIVAVDGKTLRRAGEATPAAQLVEHLRSVEPGTSVKVDYLRGDKRQTAAVTTTAAEPPLVAILRDRFELPLLEGVPMSGAVAFPPFEHFLGPGPGFGELELVEVTPKLGQYFGTDKGLLVVRAPGDSAYQLEEGDVLMSIDGRMPESPGHAFRILRSYQPGEKLKLDVLRNRKRINVAVTVPADRLMHGAMPALRPLPHPAAPAVRPVPQGAPPMPSGEDDGPV
jgi:membrane-associated protease RseP (regulator of RpoE activity)